MFCALWHHLHAAVSSLLSETAVDIIGHTCTCTHTNTHPWWIQICDTWLTSAKFTRRYFRRIHSPTCSHVNLNSHIGLSEEDEGSQVKRRCEDMKTSQEWVRFVYVFSFVSLMCVFMKRLTLRLCCFLLCWFSFLKKHSWDWWVCMHSAVFSLSV